MPKLNPQQKAAVQYVNGPLLVLAGAGSGKTSVITRKISWLIRDYGIPPRNIVAVTFTNKAAREMKTRVADLMDGQHSKELLISTFHSFGLKILREHLEGIGYRPGFSLYDGEDSTALLNKLLRGQYSGKNSPAEAVRWQISMWKNNLVSPAEAPLAAGGESIQDVAARVYGEYERHLQAYNAMDLDDLILKPVRLFQNQPEILEEWRRRVRYCAAEPGWWTETPRGAFPAQTAEERLARLLHSLGLEPDVLDRPVVLLSTGERQRLALARTLIDEPQVLLLDEPTAALDGQSAALVDELIRYRVLAGRTVVLVSHDPKQIERLADARLVLAQPASTAVAGEDAA